ncbi:MAG: pyridoxamine kinase [Catonella sp.]|jgi:pyridoxine kinase|nr:pyridoxamine kinase [Catonella sp.]MDY6357786.1 pyridoxamine kinase [Catonella sp.]
MAKQKKIAAINDFTGYGRCSLTVAIPIISKLKVNCCPIPTSILSNHSGFDSFYFNDFTDHMNEYISEWKKLSLSFDGILTGFVGSARQFDIIEDFINYFKNAGTKVIVDPVMGDDGRIYSSYNSDMCSRMKELVRRADIITPNLTEACILTGTDYDNGDFSEESLRKLVDKLKCFDCENIVITGIPCGNYIGNFCYDAGSNLCEMVEQEREGKTRCGTGDVFSSIIAADAVNGVDFKKSVMRASTFIKKCVETSIQLDIPLTDGVAFEEILDELPVENKET